MSKNKRRYQAIETMEKGITAYLVMNAILEDYKDDDHPHMALARFVCKATLNELLATYLEKNSDEQLQTFLQRINQEAATNDQSSDSGASEPSGIQDV